MPTLGLSMIVKNAAETLRACLDSVKGIVDEMVIVDTGSTDNSQDIAREYGATVVSIPWENDFAKARNAALALNTTDWVLVLDADEELDRDAKLCLSALLDKSGVGGYAIPIRNYLMSRHGCIGNSRAKLNDGRNEHAKHAPAYSEHHVVRLFRRHAEIFYAGCVHELVTPRISALGLQLLKTDLCIHHFGFMLMGDERFVKKVELYLELVREKVRQEPANPVAWFDLGSHLSTYYHKYEEALRCFDRAIELEPQLKIAWLQKGIAYLRMQRDAEALFALEQAGGDAEQESSAEREHCLGDVLHNLGRLDDASRAYQRCLRLLGDDPVVAGKLGYTEVRLGRSQSGFSRMLNSIAACPRNAELHELLIKAYLAVDLTADAATAAEQLADSIPTPKRFLRAAAIRAHLNASGEAQQLMKRGLDLFPDSQELRNAYNGTAVTSGGSVGVPA
jgi:glycosyltransferase involved in cell wall biosynthesis